MDKNNLNDNFWKWFGNSKLIDNDGIPIIYYHGTKSSKIFDKFKISDGFYGEGVYFFDNKKSAEIYGKSIDCYLKIEKPFIETFYRSYYNLPFNNVKDKTNLLKNKGYDGIIASDIIVVFNSNQIKSVDNDGTWDINDNDIFS